MFQEGSPFAENRNNVYRVGCPVSSHEAGQGGITVGHLDGKGQVPYVLEKSQKNCNVIILEIALFHHKIDYVKPADQ